MTTYIRGGQQRTITSGDGCNFTTKGSVREANGKMRLHIKVCPICSQKEFPVFKKPDLESATNNGWNGINKKLQTVKPENIMYTP